MDSRLLDYYNRELTYFREMGAEFAREYPKVAGRLGLRGTEVPDPYVERLLEGVSFLTARIQLKMDAEFPRFSQRLLDIVCPHYLAPTPAMGIVQIEPGYREGSLLQGYVLPAGTSLRAHLSRGEQTACEFRTAHEVQLWPLKLQVLGGEAELADLSLASWPLPAEVRSVLRLRLDGVGVSQLRSLPLKKLSFHLCGEERHALMLLEQILAHGIGVVARAPDARAARLLPASVIRPCGMDPEQALLPCDRRVFQGYRLLHEYFAFPARFLFFDIEQMERALIDIEGPSLELDILFDRSWPDVESAVGPDSLALYCTPVVNLFEKRSDRIAVSSQHYEQHLVIDRTRPMDYEIYSVNKVVGHRREGGEELSFRPFYGSVSGDPALAAYFSTRREPRLVPEQKSRGGSRTGYLGSEVFLSLVDQNEAPYPDDLRTVAIEALCTNRDLPLLLPLQEASDFSLRVSAPAGRIKLLRGPTPPRAAVVEGEATWRLISHLNINYLSLTDLDGESGAQAMRELLQLYAGLAGPALQQQIKGIRSMRVEPTHQQLPQPGPIVFGRGVKVTMRLDLTAFSGTGVYLFGAVMEQFLARHVSINSFVELQLLILQTGEVLRWAPRIGRRPSV